MTFLAIDWGTTSRRAALLDDEGRVIDSRRDAQGIRAVPAGGFRAALDAGFGDWLAALTPGDGPDVLISGMAGSRQGWVEAPYVACPADAERLAGGLVAIDGGRIAIVPGVSIDGGPDGDAPDVMRGEEVQILGALALGGPRDGAYVLPGTHCKWARVEDGRMTDFRTCITGELYGLLATRSILAHTLDAEAPLDESAFLGGVEQALRGGGLLHDAFAVRTLGLFGRRGAGALASHLSGLLIGEELRSESASSGDRPIVLIGAPELTRRYALALRSSGREATIFGDEATWLGLHRIHRLLVDGTNAPSLSTPHDSR